MPAIIDDFRFDYRWLSNFHPAEVMLDKFHYAGTEWAYQAAKDLDPAVREVIRKAKTPREAKKLGGPKSRGGIVTLRSDWEAVKYAVMEDLVRQKYTFHPDLSRLLLATGEAVLIEGNWWHDNDWGRCHCGKRPECDGVSGKNWLGKITMEVRAQLRGTYAYVDHDEYPF
jgi:ribA/ribD-fused uncharacterized protein